MPDLAQTIREDLAAYYEMVRESVHKWVGPLTTDEIWRKPFAHGNSVGHLLLHLTGNLNYYIGARVAGTGYLRDREREFREPQPKPKEELLAAFDRTLDMVVATIREQTEADWLKEYSAEREPEAKERFNIFLRSAGHAYHHVGQIVYLARELGSRSGASGAPTD
jgi:uncharacterized damage-inducible protein DinB